MARFRLLGERSLTVENRGSRRTGHPAEIRRLRGVSRVSLASLQSLWSWGLRSIRSKSLVGVCPVLLLIAGCRPAGSGPEVGDASVATIVEEPLSESAGARAVLDSLRPRIE